MQEIRWKDGRTSLACAEHGVNALTMDARELVASVRELTAEHLHDNTGLR